MERESSNRAGCGAIRFVIVALIMIFGLVRYFSSTQVNPTTGEKQRVGSFTPEKEIALGLQAAPEMIQQFGGHSRDQKATAVVKEVGQELVTNSIAAKSPYKFEFHLLDDDKTINAFALPGGQIFITEALLRKLKTKGELAGVLGHEIGHVIERHGAEHMAKAELTQTLSAAAVVATYDPNDRTSITKAQMLLLIGQMVNMKYGRDDELESDRNGIEIMASSGYDPRSMIQVMKVLKAAGGGGKQPEFFSTHPNPDNRIDRIEEAIKAKFPNGVPSGLEK